MPFFCDVCHCNVPCANWDEHVAIGTKHFNKLRMANQNTYYNSGYDDECTYIDDDEEEYSEDDELLDEVSPWDIKHGQDSVANTFEDGTTTIEEGVNNILYHGARHPVRVYRNLQLGVLIAINNRTLHCYRMAGVDTVPVIYVNQVRRRAYDSVFVRGG